MWGLRGYPIPLRVHMIFDISIKTNLGTRRAYHRNDNCESTTGAEKYKSPRVNLAFPRALRTLRPNVVRDLRFECKRFSHRAGFRNGRFFVPFANLFLSTGLYDGIENQ